jgi:hypothetical protein
MYSNRESKQKDMYALVERNVPPCFYLRVSFSNSPTVQSRMICVNLMHRVLLENNNNLKMNQIVVKTSSVMPMISSYISDN